MLLVGQPCCFVLSFVVDLVEEGRSSFVVVVADQTLEKDAEARPNSLLYALGVVLWNFAEGLDVSSLVVKDCFTIL